MYKKMLVPLDGSELAEVVFTYVKELAARLDTDVTLLHVSRPAGGGFTPMYEAYVERAAGMVKSQIQEVRKKVGGKAIKVQGEVVVGYPAEEVLRYAEEKKINLIVMATHGHSGVKHWAMGNVADKVLRASKIPVLLIRAGVADATPYDKWPTRTILAPLDGSEQAESVLPHVEALAKQRSIKPVEVVLLRVCEPHVVPSYYTPELPDTSLNWGEYMEQDMVRCKKEAEEYLAKLEKRFKDIKVGVRSDILVGKAADEIVDYTNKNPFNLIVMTTHGRSGLSRWIYGSVAENVLQGVSVPLLLIRPG
jgi:nucleotide-binding universal stress UspA family protein